MRRATAVVVGNSDDLHLRVVVDRLAGRDVMVFDAATLSGQRFRLDPERVQVGDLCAGVEAPAQGWLRRLAPPNWQRGLMLESHDAVVKAAWLAFLVSVTRVCGIRWLTSLDALIAAENKLVQASVARGLGIAVPETTVTNDPEELKQVFPEEFIVKPLGPGHFYEEGEARVVFSTVLRHNAPELRGLGAAPFLAQRRLRARRHLRVVTVRERLWAASLGGEKWPVDWRSAPDAHSAFVQNVPPTEVTTGALAITERLSLGFSSQDWLVCDDACYLVDVNPAGQWLFLPEPIASSVARAIAAWLGGTTM